MSLLDGSSEELGRLPESVGTSDGRCVPGSTDQLPAERLAAVLEMLPVVPSAGLPSEARSSQFAGWVPKRMLGAEALQAHQKARVPDGSTAVAAPPAVSRREQRRRDGAVTEAHRTEDVKAENVRTGGTGTDEPTPEDVRTTVPDNGRHRAPASATGSVRSGLAATGAGSHLRLVVGALVLLMVAVAVISQLI